MILAAAHLEAHMVERTELLEEQLVPHDLDEVLLEVVELLVRDVEDHRDVVDLDRVLRGGGVCHGNRPR